MCTCIWNSVLKFSETPTVLIVLCLTSWLPTSAFHLLAYVFIEPYKILGWKQSLKICSKSLAVENDSSLGQAAKSPIQLWTIIVLWQPQLLTLTIKYFMLLFNLIIPPNLKPLLLVLSLQALVTKVSLHLSFRTFFRILGGFNKVSSPGWRSPAISAFLHRICVPTF